MTRKTDNEAKHIFQVDRFVQQNGEWFYMTRDGDERGPFKTKADAEADLVFYILECRKKENFDTE